MKRKKYSRKKQILQFSKIKGSITFKVLMAVVILGSISLVSGIFPKQQITPQDPNAPVYKPVVEDDPLQKDSLQLKTIKFEACSQTVAVEMVLDRSGSMKNPSTKIQNLKTASLFFINKLPDDAPIGLVTFSNTIREEFPIQKYSDIKVNIQPIIKGLVPSGTTYTRDAMIKAKSALEVGIPKFPGRQFALILVSDGVPEIPGQQFPPSQDPRTSPNVADEIKNLGVKVYTIAITQGMPQGVKQQMTTLMKDISSPNAFFEAPDTSQLQNIYDQIGFQICNVAG